MARLQFLLHSCSPGIDISIISIIIFVINIAIITNENVSWYQYYHYHHRNYHNISITCFIILSVIHTISFVNLYIVPKYHI